MSTTVSSKRYAQAIFQIAKERNELGEWQSDLRKIAELMKDTGFSIIVENPKLPFELKAKFTEEKLGKTNHLALNLAYLLIAKNKLKNAGQIAEEYEHLLNDYHGIKRANVITAIPLDDSDKETLRHQLETIISSKANIEFSVDPSIIGGIIAHVNGSLIDGSVRNRLEILKKKLIGIEK